MPKVFDNLYPQLVSFENLYQAWHKAAKGKRKQPAVAGFEMNLPDELIRLQRDLENQTWQPSPYC